MAQELPAAQTRTKVNDMSKEDIPEKKLLLHLPFCQGLAGKGWACNFWHYFLKYRYFFNKKGNRVDCLTTSAINLLICSVLNIFNLGEYS